MSEPLRVGFVGAGWMGSALLRRLSERDDVRVCALCETNRARGQEVLDDLNLTDTLLVSDYEQIVSNSDIEAVWLVSPNVYHGSQSIAALEAGKHVFCEKPSATYFDEHRRQIELAEANPDLKTFVDYILYFDSFENRLRRMIARGDFGKITQFQVNYRHPVNIAADKAWKLKRDIMGDAIGMGINHALSVMLFAMAAQSSPTTVFATSMPAQVRAFESDPIWNIQVCFDDGACGMTLGNIDSGNGYDAYHSVYGTAGALIYDSLLERSRKVRFWREGVADGQWIYPLDRDNPIDTWPPDTTTPDSGDVMHHQTTKCIDHFVECIRNNEQSPLSFINSSTVAEVGWAAQISAAIGQPVSLPLDTEFATSVLSRNPNVSRV